MICDLVLPESIWWVTLKTLEQSNLCIAGPFSWDYASLPLPAWPPGPDGTGLPSVVQWAMIEHVPAPLLGLTEEPRIYYK